MIALATVARRVGILGREPRVGIGDVHHADEVVDIASSVAPPTVPGLYGNRHELVIDVAQPLRSHEVSATLQFGAQAAPLAVSDVRSIAYYTIADDGQMENPSPFGTALVPLASVPIRLPASLLFVVPGSVTEMPWSVFPEITFPES